MHRIPIIVHNAWLMAFYNAGSRAQSLSSTPNKSAVALQKNPTNPTITSHPTFSYRRRIFQNTFTFKQLVRAKSNIPWDATSTWGNNLIWPYQTCSFNYCVDAEWSESAVELVYIPNVSKLKVVTETISQGFVEMKSGVFKQSVTVSGTRSNLWTLSQNRYSRDFLCLANRETFYMVQHASALEWPVLSFEREQEVSFSYVVVTTKPNSIHESSYRHLELR